MAGKTTRTGAKSKATGAGKPGVRKTPGSKGFALITGASRGIGAELALQFARGDYDLVLVARNAAQLLDLAERVKRDHGRHATTISADLAKPGAVAKLAAQLEQERVDVEVLVNNVGVLHHGHFTDIDLDDHLAMVNLNIAVLTAMTQTFLQPMRRRGSGRVLNVASLAGFQPVPQLAVYAATKAYVLSLSEALSSELKGSGVTVTALCPGFVDTDMVAGAESEGLQVPPAFLMAPQQVASQGYKACMKGVPVHVPGLGYRLGARLSDAAPREIKRAAFAMMTRLLSREG